MSRNLQPEINSKVPDHINRNVPNTDLLIEDNLSDIGVEMDIVNINKSNYDEQLDSDIHELSLKEARHFINVARQRNFAYNETKQRAPKSFLHARGRSEIKIENAEDENYGTLYGSYLKGTSYYDNADFKQERSRFTIINGYLEAFENSSDDEAPNAIEQNYFNGEPTTHDMIGIYDANVYVENGPAVIYSYDKSFTFSETRKDVINSPTKELSSNTCFVSDMESVNGKSFYRVSKCFYPVIIPRLPLNEMLPTVTELCEPIRQSDTVTDICHDENGTLKRKTINSWVMNDEKPSDSEGNDTTVTNCVNSADESSPNITKASFYLHDNTVLVNFKKSAKDYNNDKSDSNKRKPVDIDRSNLNLKEVETNKSSEESRRNVSVNAYLEDKSKNKNVDSIVVNSRTNKKVDSGCFECNDRISTLNHKSECFSENSSIPILHLSKSTEIDTGAHSCFEQFVKRILCCK